MATDRMVFSARLVDANGRSRSCHAYYEIDSGITLDTLITGHLQGFAADLIGVTDAGIARLSVTIEVAGYVTAPIGTAPIEQTGLFNFNATGSARRWALAVPGLSNGVLIGDRIDLSNVEVAALITDFSGGEFTNDHYQGLTTLADAFVSFRKDRKQLQRASFERA